MARDGSSGGVIRIVNITRDGTERRMIPNDQLNQIYGLFVF